MNDYFGLLQFVIIVSLGFSLLVAVVSAIVYPFVQTKLHALAPARRANTLLLWSLAPMLVGVVFTFLSFAPSFLSLMGIVQDDCTVHDAHFHLCLIHPPLPLGSTMSWVFVAFLGAFFVVMASFFMLAFVRALKFRKTLMLASYQHARFGVRVVESKKPLAIAVGFYHMRVFISDYLLQSLSARQLDVVLAHEQAHSDRKDAFRHVIGYVFSFAHMPWLRTRLLSDMNLASEQACDEVAANKAGDRLYVANTIIFLERLFSKQQTPADAFSMMGSNVQQRVESLLRAPVVHHSGYTFYMTTIVALFIFSLTSVSEFHHQIEHILELLTRQT